MIMDVVGDNSLKNPTTATTTTTTSSSNTMNNKSNDPNNKMDVQEKSPEMFCSLLEMMKMFSLDDIAQKLCLMSQIPMLCEEMRNYGYLPMLVRLLHQHSVDDHELDAKELQKTNKTRRDLAQALNNIIMNTSKCEKEIKILKILEDLQAFTETLCMRSMIMDGVPESNENDHNDDYNSVDHPCSILMDLCKMCNEPQSIELIELFGGVYVISEVIKFDYKCHPKSKNEDCFKIRLFALMIITHLTYNNPQVKSMLGAKRSFIQTLIDLLQETKYNNNEDMMQTIANVIQNLSWDSNYLSMQTMRDCQCVTHLTKALLVAKRDSTLKCLLDALGNLTASSPPNKADFCKVDGGLKFLISILEMNRNTTNTTTTVANDGQSTTPSNGVGDPATAPGGTASAAATTTTTTTATTKMKSQHQSLAIVEAGGCILRNISSYLANEERYRKILRDHKAIPLLLEHLESSSLNVVANACVILSNLSATITANIIDEQSSSSSSAAAAAASTCASSLDQIEMIEMNAVKKLANLKNSRHKIIKEGAMAAYKHLVTSQAYMLYSSFNEEHQQNKLSQSMSFSSFPMRKFKALKDEISNLSDMSASACNSVRLSQPKSTTTRQQQQQQQSTAKSSQQMMNEKFSRFSRSTSDTFATYHFQNTNGNPLPMSESMVASIPTGSKGNNSVHNCDNDSAAYGGGGVSSEYDIYSGDAKCQILKSGNANNGKQPMPSSSASSSSFLEDGEIDEDYTTDFSERYKEQNLDEFRMGPDASAARRSSMNKNSNQQNGRNNNNNNNHDSNANKSGNVKDCGEKGANNEKLIMKNDRTKTSVTGNTNDDNNNNNNNENPQTNSGNADNGGEDSVKIYQTEGTPLMFSLVSSLLDLSEIDLKCINEEDEGKQQQQQQQQQPSSSPPLKPGQNHNSSGEPRPSATNQGGQQSTQPQKTSKASQNETKPLLPPKPDGSPNNSSKNNNNNNNTSDTLVRKDEMKNPETFQKDLGECDGQPESNGIGQNIVDDDDDDDGHKRLNVNDDDDDDGVGGDASADSAMKFETENTPAIFSHATSLSSLTVDDEDDENPCDHQVSQATGTGSSVMTTKTSSMVDSVGDHPNNRVDPTTDRNNVGQQMKPLSTATTTATSTKMMMKTTLASPNNKMINKNKQPPPPPPPRLEQRLDPIGSETNRSNRLQSSSLAKSPFVGKPMFKQNNVNINRQQQPRNHHNGGGGGYVKEPFKNVNNSNGNSNNGNRADRQPRSHVMVVGVCPKKLPINNHESSDDDDDDDKILQQCIECALPTYSSLKRSQQKPKQPQQQRSGIGPKTAKTTATTTTLPPPPPAPTAMPVVGQFSEHHSSLSSLSFDSDTGIGTSSGATITNASGTVNPVPATNSSSSNNNNGSTVPIINDSDIDDLDEVEDNQLLAAAINLGINCNITSPASTMAKNNGNRDGRRSTEGVGAGSTVDSASKTKNQQQPEQGGNNSMVTMVTNNTDNNNNDDNKTMNVVEGGGGGGGGSRTSVKNPSPKSMMADGQDPTKADDDGDDEKTYTICFQSADHAGNNECQQPKTNPVVRSVRKPTGAGDAAAATVTKTTLTKVTSKSIPIPSARTTILNSNNNNNKSRIGSTDTNEKNIHKKKQNQDDLSQEDRTLLANRKPDNIKDDDGHDPQQQQQQQQQPQVMQNSFINLENTKPPSIMEHCHSLMSHSSQSSSIDSEISDIAFDQIPVRKLSSNNDLVAAAASNCAKEINTLVQSFMSEHVGDTSSSVKDSTSSSVSIEMNSGLPPSGYGKRNHGGRKSQQDDRTFEIIPKGGAGKHAQELPQQQQSTATTQEQSINEQTQVLVSRKNTGGSTDTRTYNKNDLERKQQNHGNMGGGLGNIPIGYNYYESDQSDTDISEILPLDDMDDDGPPSNNSHNSAMKLASPKSPPDHKTGAAARNRPPPSMSQQHQFLYNKPNIEALSRDVGVNHYNTGSASSPRMRSSQSRQREGKTIESSGGANHGGGNGKKVYPASQHQKKHNNNRKDSLHYSCGHQLDRLEDLEMETRYYRPSSQNSRPIPQPRSSSSSSRQHHYQQQQLGLSFNPFGLSTTANNNNGGFDSKLNFNQISRSLTRGHKFMNSQADFEDKDLLFTSQHRDKVAANHVLYFQNKSNHPKINSNTNNGSNSNNNHNCRTTTKYFDRLASPMLVAKSRGRINADALIDDFDTTDDGDDDDDDDDDEEEDGDDLMEELMDPSLVNLKNPLVNDQASLARVAIPATGKNSSGSATKRKEKSLLSKLTAPFTSSSSSLSSNQASFQASANQPNVVAQNNEIKKQSKVKKSESKSRFGLPWRRSKSTHDELRIEESVPPPTTMIQPTSNIGKHGPNVVQQPQQQQQQQPSSSSSAAAENRRVPQSPSLINRLIPARRSLANHEMMANLSRNLTRSATFDTFANETKNSPTNPTAVKPPPKQSTTDGNFRFTTFVRSSPANDSNNNNTITNTITNSPDQADPESKPKQQQQQQQHRSSSTKLTRKTGPKKPTTTTTGTVDGNGGKNSANDNVAANRKTCLVTTV